MQIAKTLLFRSTLSTIASIINEARTAEQARPSIVEHLVGTAPKGRRRFTEDIQRLEALEEIHRYTEEALSKYEKLNNKVKVY